MWKNYGRTKQAKDENITAQALWFLDNQVKETHSEYIIAYLLLLRLRERASMLRLYRSANKSLARPGRKQATATEDFEFHISYL